MKIAYNTTKSTVTIKITIEASTDELEDLRDDLRNLVLNDHCGNTDTDELLDEIVEAIDSVS